MVDADRTAPPPDLAMDVRCDRCQTEYELDDESVAGAGASVQCTTCGHTFVVSRAGSIVVGTTPPSGLGNSETTNPRASAPSMPSAGGSAPPPVPEWVMATEEGQTHRLRDLTTLQKWVVERRVSRGDRVSHRGGAWRTLGDVDELRPFFDVVDQADRQTGAARAAEQPPPRVSEAARAVRPTMPATPRRIQSQVPHMSPDLDDDDILSSPSAQGRRMRGVPELIDPDIGTDDEDLSFAFKPRRTGLKVVGALRFVGLAGGAAWFMFRDPHAFHLSSGTPLAAEAAPAAPALAAPTPPPVPATPPPAAAALAAPAPPPAAAAPPVAPVPAAAVPAAPPPPPPPAPSAAAPPPKPAVEAPVVEKPPADKATPRGAPATASNESKGRSYEALVADADHALENGNAIKAQKLYDDALRQQPNGVAAMTGSAYVLLDRRRPLAAIGLFKQALSNAPHFAPALFGLGEAYRAQGDASRAVQAYKDYLDQSPTGTDAPAAHRQIKELGDAASAPRNQGPSAVVPEGARSEAAPIAPPPAPTP